MSGTDTDETAAEDSTPEKGITDEDRERIRRYLEKPPHCRSEHDLRPDDGSADD